MNIECIKMNSASKGRNLIWLVLVSLTVYGCVNRGNGESELTGTRLVEKINSGWHPVILDVRSTLEYNAGHVPGAQHVSFWTPLFGREGVPADPQKPVVVYCEHGPRAYIASWGLKKAGFRNVQILDGHMSQWRKDGLRIEKPAPK